MVKKFLLALLAYAACWVAAYCAFMLSRGEGLSLNYLIPYFEYAWCFTGGDVPGFIWLLSLALYALFIICWIVIARSRGKNAA